ncbi:type II toxin-antitoxin system VapB family antitoxin [Mesorhizobium sp. M1423]|uniref:type II toxin-antitoxin system VapB family antitoxin n=1 Tax=Mesorhizobium sp. M1423 TaxID=2957101 RepID=UPI003334C35C
MAFHIKNPETDALARRVAALKRTGLTEAVHAALKHGLEREQARPSLVEIGVTFCRDLRARGKPDHGRPADKAFRHKLRECHSLAMQSASVAYRLVPLPVSTTV